jgi:hypothetical protein
MLQFQRQRAHALSYVNKKGSEKYVSKAYGHSTQSSGRG